MDMVRRVKRITGQKRRVGHGGTLDPLAEGVLPICIGQATRLMEYLVEGGKEYRMKVRLGITTSTYDGEGGVVKRGDASSVDVETTERALDSFRGVIDQIPPMYSAIKVEGKRLYDLARSGVEVERKPRKVEVSKIEIEEFDPPLLVMRVHSGRGAYMRSLAHDLGEALGCGGYLSELVRLRSGPFDADSTVSIDRLEEMAQDGSDSWKEHLSPPDFVLLHLKSVGVTKAAERYIRNGQPASLSPRISVYASYMEMCRAYTEDGRFLAVMTFDKPTNLWHPDKVLNLDKPSPYAPAGVSD